MVKASWFQQLQFAPLYPLFFAAYPALALVGININEVEPAVLWRPLIILVLSTVILLIALRLIIRDWHRAALLLSVLIFLFFTYGHLYLFLKRIDVAGFVIGRHRYMVPLWLGIGALVGWWVIRKLRTPQAFAPVLNLVSIFLLIYPSFQIISYSLKRNETERTALQAAQAKGATLPLGYAPDIYYIILDAYGRADPAWTRGGRVGVSGPQTA